MSDEARPGRERLGRIEEHLKGLVGELDGLLREGVSKTVGPLVPPGVLEHLGRSKREALQALRVLIDRELQKPPAAEPAKGEEAPQGQTETP
ncbi:MAG: hypothetical protein N2111_07350 [Candidatus Sumerlaeaceae bacterium]|nr:hypothetical protein [Candidatus Sumerlaeaceae bacterium]